MSRALTEGAGHRFTTHSCRVPFEMTPPLPDLLVEAVTYANLNAEVLTRISVRLTPGN
jgi:hypothetical protein